MDREPASTRRRTATLFALAAAVLVLVLTQLGVEEATPPAADPEIPPAAENPPILAVSPFPGARVLESAAEPVPDPPAPPDLDAPFAFALHLQVVDAFSLPVEDALVFAAPDACGFALWPASTDAQGRLTLGWRARRARMPLALAVLAYGVLQPLRRLELDADKTARLTMAAHGRRQETRQLDRLIAGLEDERFQQQQVRLHKRPRSGRLQRRDELDVLCGRTLWMFRGYDCTNCHEPSRIAAYEPLRRAGHVRLGLHPHALFADQPARMPSPEELRERDKLLAEEARAAARERAQRRPRQPATVSGIVTGADGKPAARVPVAWLDSGGGLRARTETNDSGSFRLWPVAAGTIALSAGGADAGFARTLVTAVPDMETCWDLRLDRAGVATGTATDEQGRPLQGWRVELEAAGEPWAGIATTGDDGTFACTGVPGAVRCLLWPKDTDLHLPVVAGTIAMPDGDAVRLQLDRDVPARARLRVQPGLPPGHEHTQVELRVFQEETGRGAHFLRSGQDEGFELEGLAAGFYRVELGAPALGWVTAGPVHLDGRGLWDLGRLILPRPGRARIEIPPGGSSPLGQEHGFWRREAAVDVRVEALPLGDDAVSLPRGEYLLLWQGADGDRAVAFGVESDKETVVPIPNR
jgi:hypothetical protein